jgi:gamma-glutamylcyclotransferase (GGCT)/AIG2-like uncharacterized protein YtfP
MSQSLYAFYGSLRRGMRLHHQFKNDLKYRYHVWLSGYDLFSLGNYPYAVKSHDPAHRMLVEVVAISNVETENTIHKIEIEAGYYAEQISIGDDRVTLFLYEAAANNLRIDSGDWCIFFRH